MDSDDASTTFGSKDRRGVEVGFDYSKLNSPSNNFISVPSGRAPFFDGTHYAAWRHKMKMHLISLHLSIWKIVCVGLDISAEDIEFTSEQEQAIHRNAQATSVLLSALSPEEFNKVDGLE